ncbi:hypothetical protein JCM11491_007146 [Sporobolomyces phaffii]
MRQTLVALFALVSLAFGASPQLEWLFTANLDASPNVAPFLPGPRGTRLDVALSGGTFEGRDGLNGTIRPDSHDWAILDPLTGLAFADARWAIELPPTASTNGYHSIVYVTSSGPSAPSYEDGTFVLHLRLVLETGVLEHYWMNNVVVIGVLEIRDINNLLDPSKTAVENVHIKAYTLDTAWRQTDKVFTCLYDDDDGCASAAATSEAGVADEDASHNRDEL